MDLNTAKINYSLRLADNSLIFGQQLTHWCGHGPVLEEDIALTNIALDYIGQCQLFYDYAAKLNNTGDTHDDYAFLRDSIDFQNFLLIEQPNGDFAVTIMKIFLFSSFQFLWLEKLCQSNDNELKGLAEKSIKEVKYHLRHSREWLYRLGDGTDLSNEKLQAAVDTLWTYTGEFFVADELDNFCHEEKICEKPESLKYTWETAVQEVFKKSKIAIPTNEFMQTGGKVGTHSEHHGFILAEMQFLQRAYPHNEW